MGDTVIYFNRLELSEIDSLRWYLGKVIGLPLSRSKVVGVAVRRWMYEDRKLETIPTISIKEYDREDRLTGEGVHLSDPLLGSAEALLPVCGAESLSSLVRHAWNTSGTSLYRIGYKD